MKEITYNGETHTFQEWCRILQELENDDDLRDFAKELPLEGRVSNDALYTLYTIWKGKNCISKASFSKRIPLIFKQCRPDLKRYRTNSLRGWEIK